ncbi:M23 family metallopeptidase [Sphingomonas sp.]|uniref:M23 family metallopeptidase n=1 Tax=Sphingomonas sp. TaxID=28214 RepID=UPI001B0590FE|nr:M23 family metallopeptidase [Sphingomonas sp.]MBO9712099.1 M23 family metallopeptidase [Sphingomonas sp.]
MARVATIGGGVMIAALLLLASMVRITINPRPPSAPAPTPVVAQLAIAQPRGAPAADPQDVGDHPLLGVPVAGVARASIHDNWGDPRDNGLREHHGTDIMAPQGTPVVAAAPGTVEKLFYSNGGGGITVYVRSPDRLWSYYYAHLQGYAPGLREGQGVAAGDSIGFVGDTGNAGAGNFHLHFGLSRMKPEDRWWQGEAVNPYPLLAAGVDR